MPLPRLAALVLTAALLMPAAPVFADPLADAVAQIPGSVEDLSFAGEWTLDGRTGAYRVVVARDGNPMVARLFVQWVALDAAGHSSVYRSIEIPEFAALKTDISSISAEGDPDGLAVFVDAADPDGQPGTTYELFVNPGGDYRFGPASN